MTDRTVRYTSELKRQRVALARSGGAHALLLREFGGSASTKGGWVKQDARVTGKGDSDSSSAASRHDICVSPEKAGKWYPCDRYDL